MADMGLDPLPAWKMGLDPLPAWKAESASSSSPTSSHRHPPLHLLTGAAHHFVTTSFANRSDMLDREGEPFLEMHPTDAELRQLSDGQVVRVENERGWCRLRLKVTKAVRPGVVASPKGRWGKFDPFREETEHVGRHVNWLTSDALGDMAGQSTFHSTHVWVRAVSA